MQNHLGIAFRFEEDSRDGANGGGYCKGMEAETADKEDDGGVFAGQVETATCKITVPFC